MRRLGPCWFALLVGCSSANFDVGSSGDTAIEDAASSADTAEEVFVGDDDGPIATDAGCAPVDHATVDVWVDSGASPGGGGAAGCPFRTLAEAASAPFNGTVDRVVHVRAGTYDERSVIKVRSRETYRAEDGVAKIYASGTGACAPSTETCAFLIEANAMLDGLWIEAVGVSHGVVVNSTSSVAPVVKNTTVRSARKDGVVVFGASATFGPNAHVDANGWSGLVMRGSGRLNVTGVGNSFDGNKGGIWSGGTFIPGAGIYMVSGNIFLDGGATANANYVGVLFDWTASSVAQQTLSQLTAQSNRNAGVVVSKGWSKVSLRKCLLTKNANVGLRLEWDAGRTNDFDIGEAGSPGSNVLGGPTYKNGRAGLFLCGAGPTGSYSAEVNQWSACPPPQQMLNSCDALPTAYTDVAYVPHPTVGASAGANPLAAPTLCSTGP